jgi:L-fucose isomerase-like protein
MADDGIDAGCEGDIPSILALRWMRLLSGRPAWMANPSEINPGKTSGRGNILLAHCTVPRSLLTGYGIRSHFESGLGVAIAGKFAPGPVTLARIGGVSLDQVWLAEGQIMECPSDEGLCRTQAVIEMENADLARLLDKPLGNHLVVGFGHWAKMARRYLSMENIREI